MILVDANLLIYAAVPTAPRHGEAKAWLDGRLNGVAPVGLPWESLTGYLRIVTNPRVFDPPAVPAEAWKVVRYWLDCAPVWIPQPTGDHTRVLERLYAELSPAGNLVPDTHLAALALEHGLILCSTDADFARFTDLTWENPLSGI